MRRGRRWRRHFVVAIGCVRMRVGEGKGVETVSSRRPYDEGVAQRQCPSRCVVATVRVSEGMTSSSGCG